MPLSTTINTSHQKWSALLSKVPEITAYFWIIKVLCTTVGETAADFLNINLNFGLTGTSIVTGVLLCVALLFQFRSDRYVPWIYWFTVTLVSVFGTLVTDNFTDAVGVPLETSTLIFSALLAAIFLVWYLYEKTLSIHSIFTVRREVFYWFAILFTFALGTASGDLMAEGLALGYVTTGAIVAAVIALTAMGWKAGANSVLSFWIIYILTRPLGASIGDFLSQSHTHGGLGLGATTTSVVFLGLIAVIVTYLSLTKNDVISGGSSESIERPERYGLVQTVIVGALVIVGGGIGYQMRQGLLQAASSNTDSSQASSTAALTASPLGDLTLFRTITQDSLDKLSAGDQSGATARIGDLEYEWDNAASRLQAKNRSEWTKIDGKIDTVLRELRAVHPNPDTEKAALMVLLAALQ